MSCSGVVSRTFTHRSTVRGLLPTGIPADGKITSVPLLPFRSNAWPTLPGAKVALPSSVPAFGPAISFAVGALPLPSHQLTIPLGGGVQVRHLPAKLAL